MPRITVSILLCVIFSLSCEDQTFGPENRSVVLIPLAVGNQWFYQHNILDSLGSVVDSTYETIRISGDTSVGAIRWFSYDSAGYRINKPDGVWQLLPTPFLEFPFSNTDSLLQGNGTTYMRLASKDTKVTVEAGTFVCFEYVETDPLNGGPVNQYYIAPSLGIVRREIYHAPSAIPFSSFQLIDYEIY